MGKILLLRTEQERTLSKFFIKLMIKNVLLLVSLVISFFGILSTIFILISNPTENFYKYSLLFIFIPITSTIITIALATIILFVQTKNNNVDLFLATNQISDRKILFIKQYTILKLSFINFTSIFIFLIVIIFLGIPTSQALLYFASTVLSMFTLGIVWIYIFSFIALHMKFLSAAISIFSFSLIIPTITIVPTFISKHSPINLNYSSSEYNENLVKVYSIDDNGDLLKQSYAIYENPSATNKRLIQTESPSMFQQYSPFSSIFGFNPLIMTPTFNENNLNTDSKYSINYQHMQENFFSDITNYKNISIAGYGDNTIFDFKKKSDLFSKIDSDIFENKLILSKSKDANFWKLNLSELMKRKIWSHNISSVLKETISHLIGIDNPHSILYDIFSKEDILYRRHLADIYKYFENKYSKEFSDFIRFVWEDKLTKLNVYSYGVFGADFYKYHPVLSTKDPRIVANKYDIEFIKNILFSGKTVGQKFHLEILDKNDNYEEIVGMKKVFGKEFNSKDEFDDYIDLHNSINDLQGIIKSSSSEINNNAHEMSFRDNVDNNFLLTREVGIELENKTPWNLYYLSSLVILAFIFEALSLKKAVKKDRTL